MAQWEHAKSLQALRMLLLWNCNLGLELCGPNVSLQGPVRNGESHGKRKSSSVLPVLHTSLGCLHESRKSGRLDFGPRTLTKLQQPNEGVGT